MALSLLARKTVVCWSLAAALPACVLGQASYAPQAGEYAIAGSLPGDQVYPDVSLATTGGYLVWQDNVTDGDGLGISALRLDRSFSASLSAFRVNQQGAFDQERPRVTLLNNGGAAFIWQGGRQSFQHIYARFLSSSNTWATGDVQVNASTNCYQLSPALATLANGNVVAVWASINQAGATSMQDVYGQLLSPTGQKIGTEFLINQFTSYNQRTPAVAALPGGGFIVAWVSEQERNVVGNADPNYQYFYGATNLPSVDIYARLFNAAATAAGGEFLVNTSANICANPSVAVASDGRFLIAWSQKDLASPATNSWDIVARPFSSAAVGGTAARVNTCLLGDQYAPRVSVVGADYLVVWTSLDQDGSREGVFGQFLRGDGAPAGGEFLVNTTTISQQMHPAVASDGSARFLVAWTSFVGGVSSFDLYAQRYVNVAQPLLAMSAPLVHAPFVLSGGVYQPQLQVSWPVQSGFAIDHYDVYVDGSVTPAASVTTNLWTLVGIAAGSAHSFQVAYVVADGRRSPLSPSASGTAWGGYSWGGIPFEWMAAYFGGAGNMFNWPSPNTPLSPGGPTLLQVFQSGGNPLDPGTWLRTALVGTAQGLFLTWNPQPGLVYQVQTSTDLVTWVNLGGPRFAAGYTDSIYVGAGGVGLNSYRVVRVW